jgi:hypothetical protein
MLLIEYGEDDFRAGSRDVEAGIEEEKKLSLETNSPGINAE